MDDSDLERSITLTADSAEKLIMNNMVPWWIIILGMSDYLNLDTIFSTLGKKILIVNFSGNWWITYFNYYNHYSLENGILQTR